MRYGILSTLLTVSVLLLNACSSPPLAPYNWSQVDDFSAWDGKRLIFQLDNLRHKPVTHYTVVIENPQEGNLQMVVINPLGVPSFQASIENGDFTESHTLLSDRFIAQEDLLSCILLSLSLDQGKDLLLQGWDIQQDQENYTLYQNNKTVALINKTSPGKTRITASNPDFEIGLDLKSIEEL